MIQKHAEFYKLCPNVGELVWINDPRQKGLLFRVVERIEPVEPHTTKKMVKAKRWDWNKNEYVVKDVVEYGAWDASGKKIPVYRVNGAIRVKLALSFCSRPSSKLLNSKKGVLIDSYKLTFLSKVDLVELCKKHNELSMLIENLVKEFS